MSMIKVRRVVMFASFLLGATGGAANAQEITLKLAHFVPATNGLSRDFMEPWAKELEACSKGKVKVKIFGGGTQLGNITKLYDEVSAGVVDIAHGLASVPAGRFDRVRIAEMPFLFDSSTKASKTLWALYPKYFTNEFPGVKLLALHGPNPLTIHTVSASVRTPSDMRGLRMRFPNDALKDLTTAVGGTPVGLPTGEVYENAQKGVLDGTYISWDAMVSFSLIEVLKHHTNLKTSSSVFWFAMNQKSYGRLPDDVKACVDKLSGNALVNKFGDWWNKWDAEGLDRVKAERQEIIEPTKKEIDAWKAEVQPSIDAHLDMLEAKGITDARAIYKQMQAIGSH